MKKIALLLAVAMAFSAVGCASKDDKQEIVVPIYQTDKIDYKTEKAEIGDISQKYYVDGRFDYPYYEKVSFKIDGMIESVSVEENDPVEKGDLLCTLVSDDLDDQLAEKKLYIDQAQKSVNTLQSEGGSANEIQLAQTELELQQLEYQHLEDSLENYKVYAPCNGVFRSDGKTSFENNIDDQRGAENIIVEGAKVTAGQSFGVVSDHSQQYLVCDVYDNALENVNFGTKVELEQGVVSAKGKVIDIIESTVGGGKVFTYVIEPDKDADISDLGVQCCFDVYSKLDTVIVPTKAVKKSKDRTYVNLLIEGSKIEQDVEVGIEDDKQTEILSGLSGGEDVIIN